MMCGDGTNDVGALKHAHVGVSILSNSSFKKKKSSDKAIDGGNTVAPGVPSVARPGTVSRRGAEARGGAAGDRNRTDHANMTPRERAIAKHRENLTNTQDMIQQTLKDIDEEQVQIVKLGDASIAAPFTSKLSSIQCGKNCFFFP